MTDNNLITYNEFISYAPEVDVARYSETTISGMISQASKSVSDFLGYTPTQETITNELKSAMITSEGDLLIFVNKPPVQSVSRITIKKGTTSVNLQLLNGANNTKYNIDFTKRHIRFPAGEMAIQDTPVLTDFYSLRGSQFYTEIDYVGGWLDSELPATIKQACILVVREILARSQNTSGAKKISQGGISLEFADKTDSDLMKDARRLLVSYRRIG